MFFGNSYKKCHDRLFLFEPFEFAYQKPNMFNIFLWCLDFLIRQLRKIFDRVDEDGSNLAQILFRSFFNRRVLVNFMIFVVHQLRSSS